MSELTRLEQSFLHAFQQGGWTTSLLGPVEPRALAERRFDGWLALVRLFAHDEVMLMADLAEPLLSLSVFLADDEHDPQPIGFGLHLESDPERIFSLVASLAGSEPAVALEGLAATGIRPGYGEDPAPLSEIRSRRYLVPG